MTTIYTIGYNAGWTLAQLKVQLRHYDADLIDIRYRPTSTRAEWQRHALPAVFGSHYRHIGALGNRNYANGGPIELAAPDHAVPQLRDLLAQRSIVLLCGCPDVATCHRAIAANWLSQRLGNPVLHLSAPLPDLPVGAMRAITIRQPWAWAIVWGTKDIENRTQPWPWNCHHGPVAIHAATGCTRAEYAEARDYCLHLGLDVPPLAELPRGAVVGMAQLEQVVTATDSPWFNGPYGLVLTGRRALSHPIPAKGALGLWAWKPPADFAR